MPVMYGVGPMLVTITKPVAFDEPAGYVEGFTFSDPLEAVKALCLEDLSMDQLHRLRMDLIPRILRQRFGESSQIVIDESRKVAARHDDEPDADELAAARLWLGEADSTSRTNENEPSRVTSCSALKGSGSRS